MPSAHSASAVTSRVDVNGMLTLSRTQSAPSSRDADHVGLVSVQAVDDEAPRCRRLDTAQAVPTPDLETVRPTGQIELQRTAGPVGPARHVLPDEQIGAAACELRETARPVDGDDRQVAGK